jgi:hypothetical protein
MSAPLGITNSDLMPDAFLVLVISDRTHSRVGNDKSRTSPSGSDKSKTSPSGNTRYDGRVTHVHRWQLSTHFIHLA